MPLDGSQAAEPALLHARDLAHDQGAALHLIQVVPHNVELGTFQGVRGMQRLDDFNVEMVHEILRGRISQAERYLEEQRHHLEQEGIQTMVEVLRGGASQQIVRYSQDNDIDIVVMSTHGEGGVHRLLVGSITEQVIRSTTVPVLVVPSEPASR